MIDEKNNISMTLHYKMEDFLNLTKYVLLLNVTKVM